MWTVVSLQAIARRYGKDFACQNPRLRLQITLSENKIIPNKTKLNKTLLLRALGLKRCSFTGLC